MLTTGSKLLVGSAVAAAIAAVVYGIAQEGALGTVGLSFAAAALALLAGVNLVTRDADVSAMDTAAHPESAAARPAPGPSAWPVVGAVGVVLVAVGSVTYPAVFVFGLIAILVAVVEWMIQAWSERASADVRFNTDVRERLAHPLEFPLLAAVGAGIIIYSFSRIMLFLSKTGGVAAFAVIAALVLLAGFIIAVKPSLRSGAIGAVAAIAGLGLVAGGAVGAIEGERDLHPHETTADLASDAGCDSEEETEADERASQSLAAKSNLNGVITLGDDGRLRAETEGLGERDELLITRALTANVQFRNESAEERRLVLDVGPMTPPGSDTEVDVQYCTALVEEGGTQFLTFRIDTPSAARDTPYVFRVPGAEGAELQVVVP